MSDSDVLAIGDPGRTAIEIGPCAPTNYPDSADHELSESAVPGAQIRAASVRGLMHRHQRTPRQDRYSIVYDDSAATLIITVCDGVGQFDLSYEAAAFVAADTPRAYMQHGAWHPAVADVNERLAELMRTARHRTRLTNAPADLRMATTLAAVAIRLDEGRRLASIVWTDDTLVWLLSKDGWEQLTADASEVDGGVLHSTRVRALPNDDVRLAVMEKELVDVALFVMTDGVSGPLRSARQVQSTLAEWWATPPDIYTFARQVGFARKSHLDDRTVVGVWFEPLEIGPAT